MSQNKVNKAELERLIANVNPRAKIPKGFQWWSETFIVLWLRQHQKKESKQGNKMYDVYEGIVSCNEFGEDEPEHVYASWVFETFNCNLPADYRNRSMSVGDVVVLVTHMGEEGEENATAWACELVGWKQVSIPETQEKKLYAYKVFDGIDGREKVILVRPNFGFTPDVIEHLLHGRGYNKVQLIAACENWQVFSADELIPPTHKK